MPERKDYKIKTKRIIYIYITVDVLRELQSLSEPCMLQVYHSLDGSPWRGRRRGSSTDKFVGVTIYEDKLKPLCHTDL